MSVEMAQCLPVVSAIIERRHNGKTQILVQTRWKPKRDPVYSGALEMPAGVINAFENVYEALKREVFEETGLTITRVQLSNRTKRYTTDKKDASFSFVPFCCYQQLNKGKPWVGFAFVCQVRDEKPKPQRGEVKNIRWIDKEKLKWIYNNSPEKIFTLQLGVLDYYFNVNN